MPMQHIGTGCNTAKKKTCLPIIEPLTPRICLLIVVEKYFKKYNWWCARTPSAQGWDTSLRARPASSAPSSPSASRQRTEYISCTMNANSYNGKHCQKLNCLYWIIIVTGSWVLHHVGCIQLSPILGLLILFWCVFSWDWCVSLVVFRSKLYLM